MQDRQAVPRQLCEKAHTGTEVLRGTIFHAARPH